MDSLEVKAVLDYNTFLQLKSEQDKSSIAADSINKDLGIDEISSNTDGARAIPYNEQVENKLHIDNVVTRPSDKIYNEYLVKDTEPKQDSESDNEDKNEDIGEKIDNEHDKTKNENLDENDNRNFQFLSRMPLSTAYEKKAQKVIELIGLDPNEKTHVVDGENYTTEDLKTIFYQLYVKKTNNYGHNRKFLSFLKSLADRNMFNLIKNKSLLSRFKVAWYLL